MTDPNNWTKSYVQANAAACVEFLIETNRRITSMLYEKNYAAAIAGMDRVLNGLVTMQNAGCGNFGSHIAVMSFAEGTVIAFGEVEYNGKTASEANRRATAIKAFEDARDFASSEQLKNSAAQVISLLKSGQSLASITQEQGVDMPEEAIDGVDTVTRQLEKLLASGAVANKKGKGCLLAVVAFILIGCFMLYLYFAPHELNKADPAPLPAVQTTTEHTQPEETITEAETTAQETTQQETTQTAKLSIDEDSLADIGRSYDELVQKYGPETERDYWSGGEFICFQNSRDAFFLNPNNRCWRKFANLSDLFNGHQLPISITEVESALGVTVDSEYSEFGFEEVDGTYSHTFYYKGHYINVTSNSGEVFDINSAQIGNA